MVVHIDLICKISVKDIKETAASIFAIILYDLR